MKIMAEIMGWNKNAQDGLSVVVTGHTKHETDASTGGGELSDDQVKLIAFEAKNGAAIEKLYKGDISKQGDDHSAGDQALTNHLAFYTQDRDQLDRLFKSSKLYRPKWDERHSGSGRTYGEMTIDTALTGLTNVYSGTDSKPLPTGRQLSLIPVRDIMRRSIQTDWLIKNYLEADSTSMLFGAPSSAKSLMAVEQGYCIGLGIRWYGYPVKQGNVIYIAGEGFKGLIKRLTALSSKYGKEPENLFISEQSIDLYSSDSVAELQKLLVDINEICLIIIDTLHRNFTGDEDQSKDFGIALQHCDQLRNATGASIMLVHHSGHNSSHRGRGSSSMSAGMDAEYKVSKNNNHVTMSNTKMKDNETPSDMCFTLTPTEIGRSDDGEVITAPVLTSSTPRKPLARLTNEDQAILAQLKTLLGQPGITTSANDDFYSGHGDAVIPLPGQKMVDKKQWLIACKDIIQVQQDSKNPEDAKRKRFDRSLEKLVAEGRVAANDAKYFIIPASTEEKENSKNPSNISPDTGHP